MAQAHPHDAEGSSIIRHVFKSGAFLRDSVRAVYLENYDMRLAGDADRRQADL